MASDISPQIVKITVKKDRKEFETVFFFEENQNIKNDISLERPAVVVAGPGLCPPRCCSPRAAAQPRAVARAVQAGQGRPREDTVGEHQERDGG